MGAAAGLGGVERSGRRPTSKPPTGRFDPGYGASATSFAELLITACAVDPWDDSAREGHMNKLGVAIHTNGYAARQ